MSECLKSLNNEQRLRCFDASNNCLSAKRLQQRLIIFKRYFIALNRSKSNTPIETKILKKQNKIELQTNKYDKKVKQLKSLDQAALGLARVGSRAALNFSFAFLKRAWRLGEDADICSELLTESLDALQLLPEATLFNESNVSQVWLEVVDRSTKFLRQVVTG